MEENNKCPKKTDTQCCVKFNPEKWDNKIFEWDNKIFIEESIPTFFHIPFPPMIWKKITKMWELAKEANAMPKNDEDCLVLFYDPHPFKSELYMTVTKDVPNAQNKTISWTFQAKVFDWPYNAIPKFMKQMDEILKSENKKALKYYIHYAYCPGCSKKYWHNYMILFAWI